MTTEEKLKTILLWDYDFELEEPKHTTKVIARSWVADPFVSLVYDNREQAITLTYGDVRQFILKMCESIERERRYL